MMPEAGQTWVHENGSTAYIIEVCEGTVSYRRRQETGSVYGSLLLASFMKEYKHVEFVIGRTSFVIGPVVVNGRASRNLDIFQTLMSESREFRVWELKK